MATVIVKATRSMGDAYRVARKLANKIRTPVEVHAQSADQWVRVSTVQPRAKRTLLDRLLRHRTPDHPTREEHDE